MKQIDYPICACCHGIPRTKYYEVEAHDCTMPRYQTGAYLCYPCRIAAEHHWILYTEDLVLGIGYEWGNKDNTQLFRDYLANAQGSTPT